MDQPDAPAARRRRLCPDRREPRRATAPSTPGPPGAAHEVQPTSAYAPACRCWSRGVYWVSGGAHLTLALVLLALIGAAAVPLDLSCSASASRAPVAGLVGAAAIAVYPALLQYQALLLTEPLAATLLVGSILWPPLGE